ncbi:MAG: type II toxin-antitoxin system HicA family toxin [Deltaproteobacteria bacterium]|nr:type II toxin-antitoxin system HicA family toxin [Deltaproteobacteria bacterium]
MSGLPSIGSRECVKALERAGFHFKRQEGSHIIMRRDNPFAQTVVPTRKTLPKGTLRSIIRQSGLTLDDFLKLL